MYPNLSLSFFGEAFPGRNINYHTKRSKTELLQQIDVEYNVIHGKGIYT